MSRHPSPPEPHIESRCCTLRLRPTLMGLAGLTVAALAIGAACLVTAPDPNCDKDGDGFCPEAMGGMPGGDLCDVITDEGCGDATQPETVYPGAPETCADIGIDNNLNGDAYEVDGLGEVCKTGICDSPNCLCRYGERVCEGYDLVCRPDLEQGTVDERCDGTDSNCNGIEDWADDEAIADCKRLGSSFTCVQVSPIEAECRLGCTTLEECRPQGDRCVKETGEEYGVCMCGDGPEDHACGENFLCGEVPGTMPARHACLCGATLKACGRYESCSDDGNCTCGSSTGGADLNDPQACPDDTNAPDCNATATPPRCDCDGIVCQAGQACCNGICKESCSHVEI